MRLTTDEANRHKGEAMEEHLRYEKMKLVAREEKRRRVQAEKALAKIKKVQKPKSSKRRNKKKPVTIAMSTSESSGSETEENEISIESIKLNKKFRRANAGTASITLK